MRLELLKFRVIVGSLEQNTGKSHFVLLTDCKIQNEFLFGILSEAEHLNGPAEM